MQPFQRKKIPKKFHPLREKVFGNDPDESFLSSQAKEQMIAKYTPRHLEYFRLDNWLDFRVVKALKRVKKIRSIREDDYATPFRSQWRLILQSKFKHVLKFTPNADQRESIKMFKDFSNIADVSLDDKYDISGEKGKLPSLSWNVLRYVPGMINLKSLYLSIVVGTRPDLLLKRLNLMSKTLFSLQTLRVSWDLWNKPVPFSFFVTNTNILKCLTHMCVPTTDEDKYLESFELLVKYCQNLTCLYLIFQEKKTLPILSSLKNFEKLERIYIELADLLLLIDHFTLPPSIKHIEIISRDSNDRDSDELAQGDKTEALIDSLQDLLDNKERLESFSEKWRNLNNLISLSLSTNCALRAIPMIFTLIKLILKSIPSLKNLKLNLLGDDKMGGRDDHHKKHETNLIDLVDIFGALQGFSENMETITLELRLSNSYSLTWLPERTITFPKLNSLELTHIPISDLSTIQNIFNALKKPSTKDVKVVIHKYIVNSNLAFLELLQIIVKSPMNLKIEFYIEIEMLDFDTFDEIFREFIERMERAPVIKNVSLNIDLPPHLSEKRFQGFDFLFNIFDGNIGPADFLIDSGF